MSNVYIIPPRRWLRFNRWLCAQCDAYGVVQIGVHSWAVRYAQLTLQINYKPNSATNWRQWNQPPFKWEQA
jgi:hypothetical protein